MIRRIVIAPLAKADARDIWLHTSNEHGAEAADAYLRSLDQAMQRVREFPDIGSDCSDVRKGYRRIRAGSHLIYYISGATEIYVSRILHERQDPTANLR